MKYIAIIFCISVLSVLMVSCSFFKNTDITDNKKVYITSHSNHVILFKKIGKYTIVDLSNICVPEMLTSVSIELNITLDGNKLNAVLSIINKGKVIHSENKSVFLKYSQQTKNIVFSSDLIEFMPIFLKQFNFEKLTTPKIVLQLQSLQSQKNEQNGIKYEVRYSFFDTGFWSWEQKIKGERRIVKHVASLAENSLSDISLGEIYLHEIESH